MRERERDTTEGKAIASNNTGLNNSVLLPSKGLGEKSHLGQQPSPGPHKEEPQQASSNIKRRDDPNGEI